MKEGDNSVCKKTVNKILIPVELLEWNFSLCNLDDLVYLGHIICYKDKVKVTPQIGRQLSVNT